MTNANVSNLPFVVQNPEQYTPKVDKPDVKGTNGFFEQTLKNVADKSLDPNLKTSGDVAAKQVEKEPAKLKQPQKTREIKRDDDKGTVDEKLVEKVNEVANDIKDVIEEEFDVTEEEFSEVMENLGLMIIDLLNPQNLAEVVTELTGETDSISLIMNEDFADILEQVNDLTKELFADDRSFMEIKELFISLEANLNEDMQPKDLPEMKIPKGDEEIIDVKQESEEPVIFEQVARKDMAPRELPEEKTDEPLILKADDKPETVAPKEGGQSFEPKDEKDKGADDFKMPERPAREVQLTNDNVAMVEPKVEFTFAPEEEVVTLPTGESVPASDIANQLIEQARVLTDAESTTMEMTLNPEGLGKLFVEVTQKGDEITAKIFTENDAVKQALESQMANLRTEMNLNSTKVTSIEVSVGAHEFERNLEENTREDSRREEQSREQASKRSGRINLNSLDELSGLMSDEDMLIAQMMRDNGGTLDYMA